MIGCPLSTGNPHITAEAAIRTNSGFLCLKKLMPSWYYYVTITSCPYVTEYVVRLHGSYDAMVGGFTSDVLVDLTGGMVNECDLQRITTKQSHEIFKKLRKLARLFTVDPGSSCQCYFDPFLTGQYVIIASFVAE